MQGMDRVSLLCVVRNVGTEPLPQNSMRLRCYPVTGLDYTNGNLLPALPALAPGEAVAYKWRFALTTSRGALVAGVVLEPTGGLDPQASNAPPPPPSPAPQPPANTASALPGTQLALAVIPRLPRNPSIGDIPTFKDPLTHVSERNDDVTLLNGRVAARVQLGERREAILTLAAKEGAVWQQLANSLFLIRANLAEEGQLPWWQSMRCQRIRVDRDRDSGVLSITGSIGSHCRAELSLELRPDTCAIQGTVRLTARRDLRISGLELPVLLPSVSTGTELRGRDDGSLIVIPPPVTILPDDARIAALHGGGTTFGLAWPDNVTFPNVPVAPWKWNRLPPFISGVQATGTSIGDMMPAGSTLECQFKLFAFAPSGTVRDALRFQIP